MQERANKIEGIVFSKPKLESDCSSLCIFYSLEDYSKGRTCQQGEYQEAGSLRAILDTAYPKHPNQTFRDETIMSAMNDALDGINRLDVKEKVSELGGMTIETVKNETEIKGKKRTKN